MCNWHRPVCVACRIDMHPEKNGVNYIEYAGDLGKEFPYNIWGADQWVCKECGISVLIGFGQKPWAAHYHENFEALLEMAKKDPWTVIERKKGESESAA